MPYDRQIDRQTQYRTYAYSNGTSHKMSSLASASGEVVKEGAESADQSHGEAGIGRLGAKFMGKLRPEQTIYEARVVTRPEGKASKRKSIDSGNSQRMIIKKGVGWSVDYDGRNGSPGSKEEDFHAIDGVNSLER